MRKVILLAGFSGSGKTTLAEGFENEVHYLNLDQIQKMTVYKTFGENCPNPFSWAHWKKAPLKENGATILQEVIIEKHPTFIHSKKTILVEGSILIWDVFTEQFLLGISNLLNHEKCSVICFLLNIHFNQLLENKNKRKTPNDGKDLEDQVSLHKDHQDYHKLSKNKWIHFKSFEACQNQIKKYLTDESSPL